MFSKIWTVADSGDVWVKEKIPLLLGSGEPSPVPMFVGKKRAEYWFYLIKGNPPHWDFLIIFHFSKKSFKTLYVMWLKSKFVKLSKETDFFFFFFQIALLQNYHFIKN